MCKPEFASRAGPAPRPSRRDTRRTTCCLGVGVQFQVFDSAARPVSPRSARSRKVASRADDQRVEAIFGGSD